MSSKSRKSTGLRDDIFGSVENVRRNIQKRQPPTKKPRVKSLGAAPVLGTFVEDIQLIKQAERIEKLEAENAELKKIVEAMRQSKATMKSGVKRRSKVSHKSSKKSVKRRSKVSHKS